MAQLSYLNRSHLLDLAATIIGKPDVDQARSILACGDPDLSSRVTPVVDDLIRIVTPTLVAEVVDCVRQQALHVILHNCFQLTLPIEDDE